MAPNLKNLISSLSGDPLVLATGLVLLVFSVSSWSIVVIKVIHFFHVGRQNRVFFQSWDSGDRTQGSGPMRQILDGVDRQEHLSRGYIHRLVSHEIHLLERGVSFLGTTAAVTPFIGLFGTVWGIMVSFHQIGQAESASISIVAPGISAALVSTAAGLAVAIPALLTFNLLHSWCRRLCTQLEDWEDELAL